MFPLLATVVLCFAALFVLSVLLGWSLVQRARLQREIDRKERDSHRLYDFLHDLSELFSSESRERVVHRALLGGARDVLSADCGALYRIDEATQRLVPMLLDAELPPLISSKTQLSNPSVQSGNYASWQLLAGENLGQGLLGQAVEQKNAELISDLGQCEILDSYDTRLRDGWSIILAPLRIGSRPQGLLVLARRPDSPNFTEEDAELAYSVAEQCAFALQSTQAQASANERRNLAADIQRAAQVQQVLVPPTLPVPKGYKLALHASPARILSGDFHDLTGPPDKPVLIVADVCGKGLGSALLGAMARSSLRMATENYKQLEDSAKRVNRRIYPDICEDMHVTLVMAEISEDGDIEILRAGHEAPIVYRKKTSKVEEIVPPGLSIGIDPGNVFDRITHTATTHLNSGDLMIIYTDGVTEAINPEGQEFGPERLEQQVRMNGHLGAEGMLQALSDAHDEFTQKLERIDDITVVVLEKI